MDRITAYLPPDRCRALALGTTLPEHEEGSVMFADIAGFTALTEALLLARGQRDGAEELADRLNDVYTAVIHAVDRAGGSVISFSGDAITVWFAGDDGQRAIPCGMAIQAAMRRFSSVSLAVKVAVVCGPVRRYLVGGEPYGLIDTLAGSTVDRLAALEQVARPGEVLVDGATAQRWADGLEVSAWRAYDSAAGPAAVVRSWRPAAAPAIDPGASGHAHPALDDERLRAWLVPAIWARFQAGQGEFLTELRPAVALFLRFTGLAYETDVAAAGKLDQFVRWVQQVAAQFGGTLLQLTIGDKGSYAYLCFGAPVAHDDDPIRAVRAAERLSTAPAEFGFITAIQIGLSAGIMRTGAYGAAQRRTYGVLGDSVNVAARLMVLAEPGQILADATLAGRLGGPAAWEPLAPVALKGKAAPLAIARLREGGAVHVRQRSARSQPAPLVGRERELAALDAALDAALAGDGRIIGLVGEAGIGKSRLLDAWAERVAARGLTVYQGAASSYGLQTPYLIWQPVWRAFFGLDGAGPEQIGARLSAALAAFDPDFPLRAPLLSPVLNAAIPDTDFTREFDAKLRKQSREALLVESLRARARGQSGTVIILEDAHGIDALSHELLEAIGRILEGVPVLIVLAARPPESPEQPWPDPARLERFQALELAEFSQDEAAELGAATLASLGYSDPALAAELVGPLMERTRGNPFYLEEVLHYLHAQGADPRQVEAWPAERLPLSLQSVILSRVDHLPAVHQGLLKTAAIIGLLFAAEWLCGYSPSLGSVASVGPDLDGLCQRHLLRWMPADAPTYAFHHGLTQEVLYASLPAATRARLHERLGEYLEAELGAGDSQVSLLAYHYGRSANLAKKRHYLRRAGDLAAAAYANEAAIAAYEELLPLLDDPAERGEVLRILGAVFMVVGRWDDAQSQYKQALELAEAAADDSAIARSQNSLGQLFLRQARLDESLGLLTQAAERFAILQDRVSHYQVIASIGDYYIRQADYDQARSLLETALADAQREQLPRAVQHLALELGNVFFHQGKFTEARAWSEKSLAISREINNSHMQARLLNSIATGLAGQGKYDLARSYYSQSLEIFRRMGDKLGQCLVLSNAFTADDSGGVLPETVEALEESLRLARELGAKQLIANVLRDLGQCAMIQGDPSAASDLYLQSLAMSREIGERRSEVYLLILLGDVAREQKKHHEAIKWSHKGIELAQAIGTMAVVPHAFVRVARNLAAYEMDAAADMARLLSWVHNHFANTGVTMNTDANMLFDYVANQAKQWLGEDEFSAQWAAGETLSLDEAIAISRAWAEKDL